MTMKPKTRKAPAKPKKAPGAPKREASKIQELIARWKWLEADQNYQTAIASPERDEDRRHDAEQERIIAKLRTLVPQDYYELPALFRFALDEIRIAMSLRCDGADFDMLSNIHDALPSVFGAEREAAGAAFDTAKEPDIMKRIGWGTYDRAA
jgi:hypothetical protein